MALVLLAPLSSAFVPRLTVVHQPRHSPLVRGVLLAKDENTSDLDREIVRLAGPALLGSLIDPLLSLIDTAFVGQLRVSNALGATAAASELFTLTFAASLALRESASSSIARLSSGRVEEAQVYASRVLILAGFAGHFNPGEPIGTNTASCAACARNAR